MKPLSEIVPRIIAILDASLLFDAVHVLETISFSESQFRFKIRAATNNDALLQIYVYANGAHVDYSFQFLTKGLLSLRWDNKEHFRFHATFPHHFHDENGIVHESPLTGNPENDLRYVLDYLTRQTIDG